jgi:hypothetical protein
MQPTPTDKLLKPPRGGGKSKEKSGFRSAERCLRSLSRQFPVNKMRFPEVDMVFIGKPGRLLARIFHGPDRCYDRPLAIDCSVVGSPLDMRAKSQTALSELASSLSDLEAGIAL